MSEDRKFKMEFKIISKCISEIEEYELDIRKTKNNKKIEKLTIKIEKNKSLIAHDIGNVIKKGGSLENYVNGLNEKGKEIIREIFPNGLPNKMTKNEHSIHMYLNSIEDNIKVLNTACK